MIRVSPYDFDTDLVPPSTCKSSSKAAPLLARQARALKLEAADRPLHLFPAQCRPKPCKPSQSSISTRVFRVLLFTVENVTLQNHYFLAVKFIFPMHVLVHASKCCAEEPMLQEIYSMIFSQPDIAGKNIASDCGVYTYIRKHWHDWYCHFQNCRRFIFQNCRCFFFRAPAFYTSESKTS